MGSIDIEARMRNVVRYETKNMLPEATHALIEEVNEASGWTKKGMLDILSEPSVYKNEGVEHLSDLQVVVGSTNNWHDQKTEAAFGDRFPIRMVLGYLNTPEAYRMLLELPDNGVASPDAPTVTLEELAIAQDEVKNIPFSPDAADVFVRVRERFHDEDIVVSDRRWYQSRAVWRAEAWMRDGLEVEPDDLLAGKHTLWVDPDLDHRLKVASILEELCSIDNERAQEIERAVVDAWDDRPTELALLNEQVVKTRSALKDVSRLRKRSSIVTSATMTIEDMLKRFETEVEIGDEREQRRVEAEQLETARTDQIQTMRTRANADARRRRS
jgi:MoxR-like ATPase